MELPVVSEARQAIAAELDAMPTKAARHRWLTERKLASNTYATFSKHWRSGLDWARYGVSQDNLLETARLLGLDGRPVCAQLALIQELREATQGQIEAVPTGIQHRPSAIK